ncbi:site-2 protease family protein [Actinoplanes sp. NPDC049316]|uniref:site-2 protease family protein n=1 Tax=Actinoplanes sp. NPDC049316 TaxID=3154727 RepID=UPI0034423145
MRQTIRLGTVRRIPVGAHWSVLIILFLLADGLAVSLLPTVVPGYAAATYWLTATWAAVLFLGALVAHELAHAVTAQHFGIKVESITLWALGGVSTLDDKPRRARAELLTALAGPVASLVAAGLFAAASVPARMAGADLPRAAFTWLAGANLVLAAFNLLPGAPLDGGRILAAALWALRGDRAAARRTATQAGVVLGILMAGAGALLLLAYGLIGGLWLVLLGWYLSFAARGEYAAAALSEHLRGLPVRAAMSTPAVCGYAWHTIPEFVIGTARLCPHRAYPVTGVDGRLAGLVSVAALGAVPPQRRAETRLADVMAPVSRLRLARPDEALLDVAGALTSARMLVVVDGDRPCGVLTAGDVSRLLGVAQLAGSAAGSHGIGATG